MSQAEPLALPWSDACPCRALPCTAPRFALVHKSTALRNGLETGRAHVAGWLRPRPRRFEQKAVAVLLMLLHLGVKNIRLGPNLPGETACSWPAGRRSRSLGLPGQLHSCTRSCHSKPGQPTRPSSPPCPHPPPHTHTAFLTPEATQLLVDTFNIRPADTKHPGEEVRRMLAGEGEVARGL